LSASREAGQLAELGDAHVLDEVLLAAGALPHRDDLPVRRSSAVWGDVWQLLPSASARSWPVKEQKPKEPDGRRDLDADWGTKTYEGSRADGTAWERGGARLAAHKGRDSGDINAKLYDEYGIMPVIDHRELWWSRPASPPSSRSSSGHRGHSVRLGASSGVGQRALLVDDGSLGAHAVDELDG
jgi:hypothetical protein